VKELVRVMLSLLETAQGGEHTLQARGNCKPKPPVLDPMDIKLERGICVGLCLYLAQTNNFSDPE
jgi:hypothetical protein